MNLHEAFRGANSETGLISLFSPRDKDDFPRREKKELMRFFGASNSPEGLKWKYLKSSKEIVCKMDLYKEGWALVPNAVIGINGEEGAGKTQLLYDLAVLYGVSFFNILTGGQTLRRAGERLKKRRCTKEDKKAKVEDQAGFVKREDADDIALDNMQFGWVESPSQEPRVIDSRLIGLAIYSVRENNPNIQAASFYITAAESERMKRLSERAEKSEEVVKAETEERRKLDIERYTRLYTGTKRFLPFGDVINPHNSRYYDYIIDNTYCNRTVALEEIHTYLVKKGLVRRTKPYDREHDRGLNLPPRETVFQNPESTDR